MGSEDIYSAKLRFPTLSFDCILFHSWYGPTVKSLDQHYNLILTGGTPSDFSSNFQDRVFVLTCPFLQPQLSCKLGFSSQQSSKLQPLYYFIDVSPKYQPDLRKINPVVKAEPQFSQCPCPVLQ